MSLVQAISSNGSMAISTSGSIIMPSSVTAGSLILAGWRAANDTTWIQLDDTVNGANSYSPIGGEFDVAPARSRLLYILNSAAGADTLTYQWTPASQPRAQQLEFSAIATSGAPTGSANATGTGTALAAGQVLITIVGFTQFIFGFFSVDADVTFSTSGAWTIVTGTNCPDTRTCFVYQEITSSGWYTPAVNANGSVTWLGQTASFLSTNSAPPISSANFPAARGRG